MSLLQEVNDCFLELFQSYLYFQSVGPNGLTYQVGHPLDLLGFGHRAHAGGTGQTNPGRCPQVPSRGCQTPNGCFVPRPVPRAV